jgi:hypothetical protein
MTVINLEHEVELRHFAHFVAIAEEGSFIRAAARVHLVQSALSVPIRSLERERGRRLFERTTHHVRALIRGNRAARGMNYRSSAIATPIRTPRRKCDCRRSCGRRLPEVARVIFPRTVTYVSRK